MFLPRQTPRFDVALRDARSQKAEFRLEAAEALGRASSDEDRAAAREALHGLLDDSVARIRAAALTALGFVGEDADVPALLHATRDPRLPLREAATIALGRLASDPASAAMDALVSLLEADAPAIRFQAIEGLAQHLDATKHEAVARLLDDPDPFVREAAIGALGGSPEGTSAHRAALFARLDDVPSVRLAAAIALAVWNDRNGPQEPRIFAVLREDIVRGRPTSETLHAVVALGLTETADDLHAIVRRFIAPARVRSEAAAALGALGDARGVAHLSERLESFFVGARIDALVLIASYRVVGCAADVARLVDRPRGVPADLIAHTLERLDSESEARVGLGRLDERTTPA